MKNVILGYRSDGTSVKAGNTPAERSALLDMEERQAFLDELTPEELAAITEGAYQDLPLWICAMQHNIADWRRISTGETLLALRERLDMTWIDLESRILACRKELFPEVFGRRDHAN